MTEQHFISTEEINAIIAKIRTDQKPLNRNNTVQPQPHELPVHFVELIKSITRGVVETELSDSLWYRCQCVGVEKAAEILDVEPDTIREWIKGGKFPGSKIGRDWMIRISDIDKCLQKNATLISIDRRYKRRKAN